MVQIILSSLLITNIILTMLHFTLGLVGYKQSFIEIKHDYQLYMYFTQVRANAFGIK